VQEHSALRGELRAGAPFWRPVFPLSSSTPRCTSTCAHACTVHAHPHTAHALPPQPQFWVAPSCVFRDAFRVHTHVHFTPASSHPHPHTHTPHLDVMHAVVVVVVTKFGAAVVRAGHAAGVLPAWELWTHGDFRDWAWACARARAWTCGCG